ncbi:MAG: DUF177 domain-containing protein [Lachnospiraceae bacterium]|nr:DUF177 domain-containing protein [Lachnospiraceae bacterium]
MLVSLSEVMNRRGEPLYVEAETGFDVFRMNGVDYPVKNKTQVRLTIKSPSPKRVLIQAEAEYVLSAPCDRCLKEVELSFPLRFQQEVDFSKQEEQPGSLEEISCISGYDLDVDRLIFEELLVAFPAKVLCKEDCRGICNICGADLNAGECGCSRAEAAGEEHLDPRMAAVRDIFKNFTGSS